MQTSTPASPRPLEPLRDALRPTALRSRTQWVDVAKGMGIVLVVFGHATGGLLKAGLFAADGAWASAFYLLYTFHMALFFALAGLFVQDRLVADANGFVRNAFTRIAWPYLLWSTVQLLVIAALGSLVNTPTEVGPWRLVSLLWEPTSQFWFLQALLVLHLACRWLLPRWGVRSLLLVALAARGVVEWVELPTLAEMLARFGLFYVLGVAAGPWLRRVMPTWPWPQAAGLAGAATLAWAVAATAAFTNGLGFWSLGALPAALAGSAAVIALARLPRGAAAELWICLGRASMTIYLLHVLFVAGTRIVLTRLIGVEAPAVILVFAGIAGIAGPLLVRSLALRAGATRALGLG